MYRKILVAVDRSSSSRRAMEEAVRIAQPMHAKIRAIYVLDRAPAYPYTCHYDMNLLDKALTRDGQEALGEAAQVFAAGGIDADTELVKTARMTEDVPECLQRYALQYGADLVVMGTHGRRGVRRAVLGSVAERFVRASSCPVLLVRGADEPDQAGKLSQAAEAP